MKFSIKKKDVINAVLTEPLDRGDWFASGKDNGTCKVCAVGAILRTTKPSFFTNGICYDITNENYIWLHINDALEDNNFLSILSCFHEAQDWDNHLPKAGSIANRDLLLHVIEAFCPPILKFEV